MLEFELNTIQIQQTLRHREAAQERLKNEVTGQRKKNNPNLWRRFLRSPQK